MAAKGALPLLGHDPNAVAALRLVGRYALGVDWQDGHRSIYPFEALRGACPCAACVAGPSPPAVSGAWPTGITRDGPGVRMAWQDGHQTTLSGRDLRRLCRCAACTGSHA